MLVFKRSRVHLLGLRPLDVQPLQYGMGKFSVNKTFQHTWSGNGSKSISKLSYWYSDLAMRHLWQYGTLDGFVPKGHHIRDVATGEVRFGDAQDIGPSAVHHVPGWLPMVKFQAWQSKMQAENAAAARTNNRQSIIEWKTAYRTWNVQRQERQRLLMKVNPEYRRVIFEQARGVAASAFDHHFDLPPWHVLRTFTKTELTELQAAGDKVIPVKHEELLKFRVWTYAFRRLVTKKKFFFPGDNPAPSLGKYYYLGVHSIHPETRSPPGYVPSERFISNLKYNEDGSAFVPSVRAIEWSGRTNDVRPY